MDGEKDVAITEEVEVFSWLLLADVAEKAFWGGERNEKVRLLTVAVAELGKKQKILSNIAEDVARIFTL